MGTSVDLEKLFREIQSLDFWLDGSGALMANAQSCSPSEQMKRCPELLRAIQEISRLRGKDPLYAMVNKLPAGIWVPTHTDTLKQNVERWHLPVVTNDDCVWWDEVNGEMKLELGQWYGPMLYWKPHYVRNHGLCERIHLIVDLVCL